METNKQSKDELIEKIMEDMLKRAKEIDNEGFLGLFTIQEILTKHLSFLK